MSENKIPSGLRQCFGKKRYATQKYAEEVAAKFGQKIGKTLRVYYCGMCNGYHATSKPLAPKTKPKKK